LQVLAYRPARGRRGADRTLGEPVDVRDEAERLAHLRGLSYDA
jgi:hypothetical protein